MFPYGRIGMASLLPGRFRLESATQHAQTRISVWEKTARVFLSLAFSSLDIPSSPSKTATATPPTPSTDARTLLMPLLGIFRRDKNKNAPSATTSSSRQSSFLEDDVESTDLDYVLPPSKLPSLDNGNSSDNGSYAYSHSTSSIVSAASSKKLKLPFRRKQSTSSPLSRAAGAVPSLYDASTIRSTTSGESTLSPRSRPSISSVFPSFRDDLPEAPTSTRSLPPSAMKRPEPTPVQRDAELTSTSKGGVGAGLMSWARERTKSRPSKPAKTDTDAPPALPPLSDESFNLMAFRHVQPSADPSADGKNRSSVSLLSQSPPNSYLQAIPRPRGGSMASASDSSQRISVAAFREAQARRSSTNLARQSQSQSPSPSLRPTSMADSVSDTGPPPRPPRATRPAGSPARDSRSSSVFSAVASSSSEASSTEEESDSDDHSPSRSRSRLSRQRTITKRSYNNRGARSDLGHGGNDMASSSHHKKSSSSRSEHGHGSSPSRVASPFRSGPPPSSFQKTSSVGTRSFSLYRRQRASYSTSELSPNAAAQRASVLVSANQRGTSLLGQYYTL